MRIEYTNNPNFSSEQKAALQPYDTNRDGALDSQDGEIASWEQLSQLGKILGGEFHIPADKFSDNSKGPDLLDARWTPLATLPPTSAPSETGDLLATQPTPTESATQKHIPTFGDPLNVITVSPNGEIQVNLGRMSEKKIYFETNKPDIKPDSAKYLSNLAEDLRNFPGLGLIISGHTDNIGQDAYNLASSLQRANAVLEFLVNEGISRDRLRAIGCGETAPVTTNNTEAGRAQNRGIAFKPVVGTMPDQAALTCTAD